MLLLGQNELRQLIKHVMAKQVTTVEQTRSVVDGYFTSVVWSILKVEWDQMTPTQRDLFVKKVFEDTRHKR